MKLKKLLHITVTEARKKKLKNHLKSVAGALAYIILSTPLAQASDLDKAGKAIGSEGGKEALNTALKVAKGKPALSVAGTIVCIACIPVAGAATSPAMCVACGILVAKILG